MKYFWWSDIWSEPLQSVRIFDLLENRTHKAPLVTENASRRFCKSQGRLTFLIGEQALTIGLIGRKAGKTEKCYCNIARPFVREKIAMVSSAEASQQRNP